MLKLKQNIIFSNNVDLDNIKGLPYYDNFEQVSISDSKIFNKLTFGKKMTKNNYLNSKMFYVHGGNLLSINIPHCFKCDTDVFFNDIPFAKIITHSSRNLKLELHKNCSSLLGLPVKLKYLNIDRTIIFDYVLDWLPDNCKLSFLSINKFMYSLRRKYLVKMQLMLTPERKLLPYYDDLTNIITKNIKSDMPKKLIKLTVHNFKQSDVEILSKYRKLRQLRIYSFDNVQKISITLENIFYYEKF